MRPARKARTRSSELLADPPPTPRERRVPLHFTLRPVTGREYGNAAEAKEALRSGETFYYKVWKDGEETEIEIDWRAIPKESSVEIILDTGWSALFVKRYE